MTEHSHHQQAPIGNIPLAAIIIDPAIQQRADGIDPDLVADYSDGIAEWIKYAPVTVFSSKGEHWLADGFHRVEAGIQAKLSELPCIIYSGGQRDALKFACKANVTHGARRTNADKRKAVNTLLDDPEWSAVTQREIAIAAGVSHVFVGKIQNERKHTAEAAPGALVTLPDDAQPDPREPSPAIIGAAPDHPPATPPAAEAAPGTLATLPDDAQPDPREPSPPIIGAAPDHPPATPPAAEAAPADPSPASYPKPLADLARQLVNKANKIADAIYHNKPTEPTIKSLDDLEMIVGKLLGKLKTIADQSKNERT